MPSDDFLNLGDFRGAASNSPSGKWTVARGNMLGSEETGDRNFCLLNDGKLAAEGRTDRRIDSASVADDGHFCLAIYEDEGLALLFFDPSGKHHGSLSSQRWVSFHSVQIGGDSVLISRNETVTLLRLPSGESAFSFKQPFMFAPTRGWVDGDTVFLEDRTGVPYRFGKDGSFHDRNDWLGRFASDPSLEGERLYLLFRKLTNESANWSGEDFLNAAGWVEEALRRGIQDSFHLKKAEVYSTLAWLRERGGDAAGAAAARRDAEENEDGFRVVDEIEESIKELISRGDDEEMGHALSRLERAESYERLGSYPNYYGRLFRFKGEILLATGDARRAALAFERALELNPKIGCKRLLEKARSEG